jgi:hypothetical protein
MKNAAIALTSLFLLQACAESHAESEVAPAPREPQATSRDFAGLCTGGEVPVVRDRVEAKAGAALPTLFFMKESSGFSETRMDSLTGWKDKQWQAAGVEDAALVACVERGPIHKDNSFCNYQRNDGRPLSVELAGGEFTAKIYDAKSGKMVEQVTLMAPPPNGCSWSRQDDGTTILTPNESKVFALALGKHQPAEAASPELEIEDQWVACSGRGIPSAPAYDGKPGASNKYTVFHRKVGKPYFESTIEFAGDKSVFSGTELTPVTICATRERGKKLDSCEFTSGRNLDIYQASWTYRMVETRTGKTLSEKSFTGKRADCPYTWDFGDGSTKDAFDEHEARQKWADAILAPKGNAPARPAGGTARTQPLPQPPRQISRAVAEIAEL